MGNTGYKVNPNILFWIRLKTLTTKNDINPILQIAYIYTDIKLTAYQMGSHIVLHCPKEQFLTADHNQLQIVKANGLYEACLNSNVEVTEAEEMILKDIEFRNIARGQLLAAGKQAHLAKYALMRHMPQLFDFLHYRIFDLTSVQLVVERFNANFPQIHKNDKRNGEVQKQEGETLEMEKQSEQEEKGETGKQKWSKEKRVNEEVWQDIHQMQFYTQHALNDQ